MSDYALMNQCIYEGKAKEVGEMTQAALDEGRPVQEVLKAGRMAHLRWSDEAERLGTPQEVANAVKSELEAKFQ